MNAPQTHAVEKVANLSHADFVKRYMGPLRPVVLTDATRDWPALEKWTPEFFRDEWGHKKLGINYKGEGGETFPLGDLVQQIINSSDDNPGPYVRSIDLKDKFPEILPDVQPRPIYALPDRMQSRLLPRNWIVSDGLTELFIGGAGNRFHSLHWDTAHMHAFIAQVYGRKDFVFFSPEDTPYLYPTPELANTSSIEDVDNPDLEKYPLFAQATPYRVTLEPGETIFVPSGWWHVTRMHEVSISVGYNSVTASNWLPFCKDMYSKRRAKPLKSRVMMAYMLAAGSAMALKERVSPVR